MYLPTTPQSICRYNEAHLRPVDDDDGWFYEKHRHDLPNVPTRRMNLDLRELCSLHYRQENHQTRKMQWTRQLPTPRSIVRQKDFSNSRVQFDDCRKLPKDDPRNRYQVVIRELKSGSYTGCHLWCCCLLQLLLDSFNKDITRDDDKFRTYETLFYLNKTAFIMSIWRSKQSVQQGIFVLFAVIIGFNKTNQSQAIWQMILD